MHKGGEPPYAGPMRAFWHWVPGKSIGPFIFGERVAEYVSDYELRKRKPDCSIAYWDTYELPGFESWIVAEEGRITDIHCVDEVEFNGQDLIGMASTEVRELLGEPKKKEENVGLGHALYYDDLGLTLFVVDDVVNAANCGLVIE